MKKVLKTLMLIAAFSFAAKGAFAQLSVSISVGIAPPALPVYIQPACPNDGYLWQPGYWAYSQNDGDYYWVPGVWVAPPRPNVYWTPAYWGFEGGVYGFHAGYWGPHVGFYGGINYGFGYGGSGYGGGRWEGGGFRYNTAVVNVNTTVVHNTYIDKTVIVNNNTTINHTSYNGPGGVTARPTAQEQTYSHEQHIQPTAEQMNHQQNAMADKSQFSKVNNGKPVAAAMDKVGGNAYGPRGHAAPATPQARQTALATRAHNNPMNNSHTNATPGANNNAQGAKQDRVMKQPQGGSQDQAMKQDQGAKQSESMKQDQAAKSQDAMQSHPQTNTQQPKPAQHPKTARQVQRTQNKQNRPVHKPQARPQPEGKREK